MSAFRTCRDSFDTSLLLGLALTLVLFLVHPVASSFQPLAPDNISFPTLPGARCVNKTSLNASDLPDATCLQYLTYDMVYMDDEQADRLVLGRLGLGGGFLATECAFWVHRLFCVQTLRPCFEVTDPNTNQSVAVGGYTGWVVCDGWATQCSAVIAQAVANLPGTVPSDVAIAESCNPPWPLLYGNTTGFVVFPNTTSYTVQISVNGSAPFNVTLPTYLDVLSSVNISLPFGCPAGFHQVGDDACTFDCPLPLLSSSEFDAITTMLSVVGWLSLAATGFLLISLLLDPKKRQYPAGLSIFFTICVMYVSFSFCLGSMIGWTEIGCADPETFNYYGDPGCTIQGLIFVYFTLASVLWWLAIAFNLFLIAVIKVPMRQLNWRLWLREWKTGQAFWKLETLCVAYHLFCWVPPIIPLIISVSAEKLGYGQDLWCTIHSSEDILFTRGTSGDVNYSGGDPANTWNLLLLSVPILLVVLIGIVLIVVVIIFGLKSTGWRFFYQQWRLFCFLLFYIWIYVFVFSFQIQSGVVATSQYSAYADYLACVFIQQDGVTNAGGSDTVCELTDHVSFPLWFIVAFNEAAQGLMVFFIFGSSWRVFRGWYRLFTDPRLVISATSHTSSKLSTGNKITGKRTSTKGSTEMLDEVFGDTDTDCSQEMATTTSSSSEEGSVIESASQQVPSRLEPEPEEVPTEALAC